MDTIALVAVVIIAAVSGLYVAVRIWTRPFLGLCLWVLLLPLSKTVSDLLGYPVGEGPVVLRKLTLSDPVLLFTALASALSASRRAVTYNDAQGRRILVFFAAYCAVSLLSAIVGDAGPESLIELATYSWLCLSLVVICRLLNSRSRAGRVLSAWRWAAAAACLAGAAGAVLLWRGSTENLLVQGGRLNGLSDAPNQLQSFMIAAIPFLCVGAFSTQTAPGTRAAHGGLLLAACLSVLASGSRGGVVWAGLAIWLMLMFTSPRAGAVWTCAALLLAGSAWRVFEQHREELPFAARRALSLVDSADFDLREMSHGRADQLLAWQTVFAEHPLLGVGPDQFRGNIPRLVVGGKAQEMHNSYLGVLADTGLLGGMLMFGLLATALGRSVRFLRNALQTREADEVMTARALLVSYVSLLLYGTVNYGLRQRYFWFVVALIMSLPPIYRQARRKDRVRAGAPSSYTTRPARRAGVRHPASPHRTVPQPHNAT